MSEPTPETHPQPRRSSESAPDAPVLQITVEKNNDVSVTGRFRLPRSPKWLPGVAGVVACLLAAHGQSIH